MTIMIRRRFLYVLGWGGVLLTAGMAAVSGLVFWSSGGQPEPQEQQIVIHVPQEVLDKIGSWPEGIACFTSAQDPIAALDTVELPPDAVGLRGAELALLAGELMQTLRHQQHDPATGVPENVSAEEAAVGMRILGDSGEANHFHTNKRLRLLITYEAHAADVLDNGGVRIRFKCREPVSPAAEPPDEP